MPKRKWKVNDKELGKRVKPTKVPELPLVLITTSKEAPRFQPQLPEIPEYHSAFEIEQLNTGSGMNMDLTSVVFTAPIAGIYIYSFSFSGLGYIEQALDRYTVLRFCPY